MSTSKELLRQRLLDTFDPQRLFKLTQVYKLMLDDTHTEIYENLKEPESTIRRDLQELRDDNILTFLDNEGTYFINSHPNVDFKENIFDLDQLKKNGRIYEWNDEYQTTNAPGIEFDCWMIAHKDEVMSHTVARKLNIPCQTREGKALFLRTIGNITNDIIENGYDYRCFQPVIEELPEPIEFEGKVYKYIVRDGNNRFELPWTYFPCALIKSEDEYSSLQFGAMANNPNVKDKKNDNTPEDVKRMIRLGFKYGKIALTQDAVYNILAKNYKETRKKDRRQFVAEILSEEGVKVSIEPYDKTKAAKDLKENYGVDLNPDTDHIEGWGRGADHYRKFFHIYEKATATPGIHLNEYAFLEMGQGVKIEPTEENVNQLRLNLESEKKIYITHCCKVADQHRSGQLNQVNVKWMAQVNETEKYNEFQ
jgi:hypothetical protein